MSQSSGTTWPIKIGQRLKRRHLHALVGGAQQWGITSCLKGAAMLVFSNPKRSRQYGYDRWEGPRSDGSYHYTGQGTVGHQDVTTRANRQLLRSKALGKPIHLFESEGTEVTYIGQHELAEDPYRWEEAPDEKGENRRVVVFHLVRVEIDHA
jgi:5-methylcytosine-specific restriction protein A